MNGYNRTNQLTIYLFPDYFIIILVKQLILKTNVRPHGRCDICLRMRKKIRMLYVIGSVFIIGCVNEIEPELIQSVSEGSLVVDARITDEEKRHTIFLSRTFDFENPQPVFESGAKVQVVDESGIVIDFPEISPGNYCTKNPIALVSGKFYVLEIVTSDGVRYTSDKSYLPKKVDTMNIWAEQKVNDNNESGIAILVNTDAGEETLHYFRYEYEETYQVIPPDFNPFEWDEVDYDYFCEDDDAWEVTITRRSEPADVCFATNKSNALILASTPSLNSKGLERFPVRFLRSDNYAISHRYSILVKQYHHDVNAASFYSSLDDFSSSENIFSNVQPGKLEGNITVQNSDRAVVFGYFELSSYSEKRMFFNYEDFYPNQPLPPYIISCDFVGEPALYPRGFHVTEIDGKLVIDGTSSSPLMDAILAGTIGFIGENEDYLTGDENGILIGRAPYYVKPIGCVDCRVYGENRVPEFWIEE